MIPRNLSHVALGVRNYERSLQFYRDLLGFEVAQEITESGGAQRESGIWEHSDRQYRIAVLRYAKETSAPYGMSEEAPVIALIAPQGTPPNGSAIKVDQVGISHFGIWVKGLDTICDELKNKGVKFAVQPHTGAKTKQGTLRTAFVEDPDGILIQLDEMVPV